MKKVSLMLAGMVTLSVLITGCSSGSSSQSEDNHLGADYQKATDVIQNAKGLSVHKSENEKSRAIEPNHKIEGLNGTKLD
jgi:hypothetical protein